MFSCHRDTVPLCRRCQPGCKAIAHSRRATALGGDDRTGVACLYTMLATLRRERIAHPPLTLLFTVREESGLWAPVFWTSACSARRRSPSTATARRRRAHRRRGRRREVGVRDHRQGAHAGLPRRTASRRRCVGRGARLGAATRLVGRIRRAGGSGTSNVGSLAAATAAASAAARTWYLITSRSKARRAAMPSASCRVSPTPTGAPSSPPPRRPAQTRRAQPAEVTFTSRIQYHPFRLDPASEPVRFAEERARALGLAPELRVSDGGLDANWLTHHVIPTVTFGAGQRGIHTLDEHVDVADYLAGCRLAVELARA